ncbi:hypothetical protein [Listeria booriae]|uniref:hypothetical protein n=2 Tax=Listeria booriae TaxID=1552123 RepID=UPI001624C4BB|nr:hypothetical protein [Listeria booriae]MBC1228293.1 hypothetical protein [Listeria booriae]
MKKTGILALMFIIILSIIMYPLQTVEATSMSKKLDTVEEKYDLEEISVAEAKELGAIPIKFNTIEELDKFLAQEEAKEEALAKENALVENEEKSTFAISDIPILSLFISKANAASSTASKTLWSNGVSTTKGYARVTKDKDKKITAVSTWSNQSGVPWPIGWESVTSYHSLKSGKKSGTATFKGNKIYYLILPVRDMAYKKYTSYTMGF